MCGKSDSGTRIDTFHTGPRKSCHTFYTGREEVAQRQITRFARTWMRPLVRCKGVAGTTKAWADAARAQSAHASLTAIETSS